MNENKLRVRRRPALLGEGLEGRARSAAVLDRARVTRAPIPQIPKVKAMPCCAALRCAVLCGRGSALTDDAPRGFFCLASLELHGLHVELPGILILKERLLWLVVSWILPDSWVERCRAACEYEHCWTGLGSCFATLATSTRD